MVKPTQKDFDKASEMLHSNRLDYDEAVVCIGILRAYLQDEFVSRSFLSRFRHLLDKYRMGLCRRTF